MEPTTSDQPTGTTQQTAPQPPAATPQPSKANVSKGLVIVLVGFLVITTGAAIFFAYQYFRQSKVTTPPVQPDPQLMLTPTTASTTEPTINLPTTQGSTFSYDNLTMNYPESWTFLDMSVDPNFPLKYRLAPLYGTGKVVALSKNGVFLIVTIEPESESGAGGVFVDDQQYNDFIAERDPLTIDSSTFYLNRTHPDILSLLEAHSGPYTWGAVTEYIPNKQTGSGEVVKGYENVIKRNDYSYNFIVTSDQGGETDTAVQKEIIGILESISW